MGIDHATRRAVFLDRDGVINRAVIRNGKPYAPSSIDEMELLPGVAAALCRLHDAGFHLVVVTNQPEIARGTITRAAVDGMHAHLAALLPIDDFRVCPHDDTDHCPFRKPKTGMMDDAVREDGLSVRDSYLVGDRWRDIEAGRRAGCTTIFIDYGYDEPRPDAPDAVVKSLPEAANWILERT